MYVLLDYLPILVISCILLACRLVLYGLAFSRKVNGRLSSTLFLISVVSCLGAGIFINLLSFFLISSYLPENLQTPAFYFPVSIVIEIFLLFIIIKLPIKGTKSHQGHEEGGSEKYTCDDGHVVKSRGEAMLDNWLHQKGIKHEYDQDITLGGTRMKYDWYLPEDDVYIEYWGFYTKEYQERRKEKEKAYAAGHKKLISIENNDLQDINDLVKKKLLGFLDEGALSKPKRCFNCGAELDERYN